MPRKGGNERYWEDVELEMLKQDISQAVAEIQLFARMVKLMRKNNGMRHDEIAVHMNNMWGISHGAYYRRLKVARETICIF